MTNQVNNQSLIPSSDVIQLTLSLKMTPAQVVETSPSLSTLFLFRTTFTWTIILNLLDVYILFLFNANNTLFIVCCSPWNLPSLAWRFLKQLKSCPSRILLTSLSGGLRENSFQNFNFVISIKGCFAVYWQVASWINLVFLSSCCVIMRNSKHYLLLNTSLRIC